MYHRLVIIHAKTIIKNNLIRWSDNNLKNKKSFYKKKKKWIPYFIFEIWKIPIKYSSRLPSVSVGIHNVYSEINATEKKF